MISSRVELNLYLIDFSGSGFDRYYQLPHVKELVSEAARDRGLSALDALHREVFKRIELCRTHGANSISELKVNNPSLNIPFLLLIVDEPEVFFNVENDIITDVKFRTFGCASAIASSSVSTDLVKGKTIEEALKLTNKKVVEELGGLPPVKMHCSVLAEEAIQMAINDYLSKKEGK